jgi:hypothetical protein
VAVWNEEARKYHLDLTNIGPEVLTPEEVTSLYSMRSEVEPCFRELNAIYALDKFPTQTQGGRGLIWSTLLTMPTALRLHLHPTTSGLQAPARYM